VSLRVRNRPTPPTILTINLSRCRSQRLPRSRSLYHERELPDSGWQHPHHSAYLRAAVGEVPFAQAFDNPLGLNEVYTVASPFIASCPSSNGALPVKAFPALTMSSMDAVMTGSEVQLVAGSGFDTSVSGIHAAFITVTGPIWTPLKSMGGGKFTVTIPEGISGQSYVVLTQGNKQATDDNIVAGPAIVEVN
jgi:hypothetical protein